MTPQDLRQLAESLDLVSHSHQCRTSGLQSCLCKYEEKIARIVQAFEQLVRPQEPSDGQEIQFLLSCTGSIRLSGR